MIDSDLNNFWSQPNNKQIINLEERKTIEFPLPINSQFLSLEHNNITVSLISGELPPGLRLVSNKLLGTPFEVARDSEFTFVLRAEQFGFAVDRTYKILVTGPDDPVWITSEGLLPVGSNQSFFIIDSVPLDFHLIAIDPDIPAGDHLEYFIAEGDGELPPGISLTTEGQLVGVVEPILALEKAANSGEYDSNLYGSFPYDFGTRPDNGFDSFFYDAVIYDTFLPSNPPKKLNRYYEFIVSVSDRDTIIKRTFQIYVVGDDYLRADNTIMKTANGLFTADNTHIRTPIWLTPSNFGYKRANNYIILFLDVIDPNPLTGVIVYELMEFNDDNTPSVLPEGMKLDESNGEIAGAIPYQPTVTKEYRFTIRAKRLLVNSNQVTFKDKTFKITLLGEVDSQITWLTGPNLGTINSNYISTLKIDAESTVPNAFLLFTLVSGQLPPGLKLNYDGEILGSINSFGSLSDPGLTIIDNNTTSFDGSTTRIDRTFNFTVKVRDNFGFSAIDREFSITVTDPINKFFSNIYAKSFMTASKRDEFGLIVTNNNLIDSSYLYRPNDSNFGIQTEMQMLVFAGIETKAAEIFISAMAKNFKRKKYKLGEIKTAIAKNPGTNTVVYEIVYIEVIDPADPTEGKTRKKILSKNKNKLLVNSSLYESSVDSVENIAPRKIIFNTRRYGDVEFLFYPNFTIMTRDENDVTVQEPVLIGQRQGFDIESNTIVGASPDPFRFRPIPENTLKVSSNLISSDQTTKNTYYISNITNMRDNFRETGETERNYLPLWMRTSQQGVINELGFVKAIPLCYCLPGTAAKIATSLKVAGIEFNQFTFDVDRFIIDNTTGDSTPQYLLFHNYEHNI